MRVKEAVKRDLEASPGFTHLLDKLAEKLEPNGRSKWTQRKVKAEKEKTDAARKKFLEKSAKVEALQEVVLKHELSNLKASHETAVVGRLAEALTLAEVTNHHFNEHSQHHLDNLPYLLPHTRWAAC